MFAPTTHGKEPQHGRQPRSSEQLLVESGVVQGVFVQTSSYEVTRLQSPRHRLKPSRCHDIVRVAEEDERRRSCRHTGIARAIGAGVIGRIHDRGIAMRCGEVTSNRGRVVCRAVVGDNELPPVASFLRQNGADRCLDRCSGVECRHHDRQVVGVGVHHPIDVNSPPRSDRRPDLAVMRCGSLAP